MSVKNQWGFAPYELPMPQAAKSTGHRAPGVISPPDCVYGANIVLPIGRECKCFCNADSGTDSATVQLQL